MSESESPLSRAAKAIKQIVGIKESTLHPSLVVKSGVDGFGVFHHGNLLVPNALGLWPIVIKNVDLSIDTDALAKVKTGIAKEQKIIAAIECASNEMAVREYDRRFSAHLAALDAGQLDYEHEFSCSRDSLKHDFEQRREVLKKHLVNEIAKTRPHLLRLVESVRQCVAKAREKMQKTEVKAADDWSAEFEASHSLKVLASIEQYLGFYQVDFENVPEMNPSLSMLRTVLPPGLLD